jgi:hypothetical protein
LIAQEDVGGVIQRGLWEVVVGGLVLVIDATGRVVQGVFSSSSDSGDEKTPEEKEKEKITDEAIEKVVKGAIATDGDGNRLTKSQQKKLQNKKPKVENFEKPEGDATTMRENIEQLAEDTDRTVQVIQSPNGTVRVVDLPTGQEARTYPKSDSTGDPTLQIELRPLGRPQRSIKIRYTKGRSQATILIPVA